MYVDVRGEKVYVGTASRAISAAQESVLFIHGAGFDHTVWTLPARYFARHGLNVVAPDLPGHGRSGGEPLTSIEAMADWLGALLDALDLHRTAVVGHSMGSLVALKLTSNMPQRVRKLVLLGTSTPMPVSDVLLDSAANNVGAAIHMANTWSHSSFGQMGGNSNPGIAMTMSGQRLLERSKPGVFHADLAACNAFKDGDVIAGTIQVPTLVILGLEDKMTRPSSSASVAAAIQGAKVVGLPDCGHSMMSEKPNEVLDALATALL